MARKLKLQVQTTVDGFMGGPNGEMDWMTMPWSDDVGSYVTGIMESVDTILLGRNLAEGFIPAWQSRPEGEPEASIDWMNNTPKVVISNTLTESPWENARIAPGGENLVDTITELKQQDGGDIIVYGGSTLVSSLTAHGLVDELHLIVNPTTIGAGLPLFSNPQSYDALRFVGAQPFDCGMIALHYAPAT